MKTITMLACLLLAFLIFNSCGTTHKKINCYSFSKNKNKKEPTAKFSYRKKKSFKNKKTKNLKSQHSQNSLVKSKKELTLSQNLTTEFASLESKNDFLQGPKRNTFLPLLQNKPFSKKGNKRQNQSKKSTHKTQLISKKEIKYYKKGSLKKNDSFVQSNEQMLFLFSSLIGALMVGFFWFNHLKLQRISLWAKKNSGKAIAMIAFVKTFFMLGGLILGRELAKNEFAFSDSTRNILISSYLAAALFYPVKKKFFQGLSFKQKIHNFSLVLSGFLLMICLGNKSKIDPNFSSPNNFIFQTFDDYFSTKIYDSSIFKDNKKQTKERFISSTKRNEYSTSAKIGLTIFYSVIFFILTMLVSYAACNLSCNGQEALALIVGVGGISGLVTGFVFLIRSIYKN